MNETITMICLFVLLITPYVVLSYITYKYKPKQEVKQEELSETHDLLCLYQYKPVLIETVDYSVLGVINTIHNEYVLLRTVYKQEAEEADEYIKIDQITRIQVSGHRIAELRRKMLGAVE